MSDFGEQEKRIAGILGEDEVPQVTDETLKNYLVDCHASFYGHRYAEHRPSKLDRDGLTHKFKHDSPLVYLQKNLEFPCYLTGIEDFSWEERYVFGGGNQKEYEKLKKTQPSYKDTFECIDFNRETDEGYGISVNVKRVSDKRKFTLPLADLESTDKQSNNYQLLDDYSVWFINYQ